MAANEVTVFVEIPAGSRNKYEVDAETGAIMLDRRLFTSMSYPAGCRIRSRPVGVFFMRDEKGEDEKIICVPLRDPSFTDVHDVHDIRPGFRDEIEHFFQVYKQLEKKKTETRGFGNRADAERVIGEARERAAAPA